MAATALQTPEEFLGHPVGADRKLAPYPRVLEYLRSVASASDRVSVETAGTSTEGNDMMVVVVTSAANQQRLPRLREISRRLAHPDRLAPAQVDALVEEGRAFVLVTCTIHSTEVGSTQMIMEFVHDMATSRNAAVRQWLDEAVLLLMPSINPDGQVKIIDWYERFLDTPFEGGPMPWLYQTYVGHDNNRDFYMLTQKETRVVNEVLYHRWFPQVFLDEHQMGSLGPRMFVPPQTDPLAPEVDSLIFRQADLLGTAMAMRLEEAGKTGVGSNMIYDSYWPGGTRNTAWWKNVTGLLTEVASVRIATPVYIEPGELRGGWKGLPEYTRRANYPSPWKGGWWRLRDIVDYELIATRSILESAATHRRMLLRNMHRMASKQIALGGSTAPRAFLIPPEQHDPVAAARLVDLLIRHGVRVQRSRGELRAGNRVFGAGTTVIPAAQAYRSFLLTMLRPQRYPEVIPYAGGPVIPPYDVTAWSLPLLMGVEVTETEAFPEGPLADIEAPLWPGLERGSANAGYAVSHAADSAPRLQNALLAGGHTLYWIDGGVAGRQIYVPAGEIERKEMARLAADLRVPVRPLSRHPRGDAFRVHAPRVALYRPWRASMDEGWTRFVLEEYGFNFRNVNNQELNDGSGLQDIDVLLLPDVGVEILRTGRSAAGRSAVPLPPPYDGGLDPEATPRIKEWVEQGGTLVALDSSGQYAVEMLDLPVRDVLAGVPKDSFNSPGSLLRMNIDTAHPLGFGLRPVEAGYFAGSPAFATRLPDGRFARRVIAAYPADARDIPVSGFVHGAEHLEKRAAVVEIETGAGRVILIGFRAQHRAQPLRTFKLLFNALYRARLEPVKLEKP